MDRDRYDRRYDDGRRGGESYRPGDRLPRRSPRPDARFGRSPVRNRSPPPFRPTADTWAPSDRARPRSRSPDTFRRRSRTPPFRGGERGPVGYNGRPRSPPPRRFSPRRENGRTSPRLPRRPPSPAPQASRRSSFSRGGSPGLKRMREPSPGAYVPRSPKRERVASPPRNRYDRPRSPVRHDDYMRPRSPDRREPWRESYGGRSWRRRSPSPAPRSGLNSGPDSTSTSRRSSPPPRMDRLNRGYGGPASQAPTYGNRSQPFTTLPPRSPPYSSRPYSRPADITETKTDRLSPPRGPRAGATSAPSIRPVEPPQSASIDREQEISRTGYRARESADQIPSKEENAPRTVSSEAPEAPSRDKIRSKSPPPGPSASKRGEPAARGGHAALLSAPTRPKGASGPYFNRDAGPRDSPRGGGSVRRPSHGPPYPGPPSVGRGGPSPSPSYDSHRPGPYRHGNTSSTTYPRTQRFTNHLSGLPTIIPGGKLLPSGLDPNFEKRIAQLEADKERLLLQIADKQKSKRTSMREWDKLSRESTTATLRSELAEGHLQRITEGDDIGGGAAF